MSKIVIGTQTAIEQPQTYGYQVGRGFYTRRRWRVTNSADVDTLTAQLLAAGFSYEVGSSQDGAIYEVDARLEAEPTNPAPEATILSETWERDTQVTEKDILESDVEAIGDLTQAEKQIIKNQLAQQNPSYASAGLSSGAFDVYLLMLTGVKSVRVYSPVIRRTRIAANNYAVKVADTNVGKRLSTGQMTSLEGAPGTLLFNLPNTTKQRDDSIGLAYGFIKKPARILQQGDGRWQIVQEYDYDLWSTLLYSAAT